MSNLTKKEKEISIISAATTQGARNSQEDRNLVAKIQLKGIRNGRGKLLAVMDGHNGEETVEKVKNSLEGIFIEKLTQVNGNIEETLQATIAELHKLTQNNYSGTSLSIAYVPNHKRRTYVAVLGDSPVIVVDKEGKTKISPEHNVRSNLAERKAAEERGAEYWSGYIIDPSKSGPPGLQLSRALGGAHIKRILNREPEIYALDLGKESIVILASDGLLDPSHSKTKPQIKRIVQMVKKGKNAQNLVQDAEKRATGDNATAVVYKISPKTNHQK